jgi:hypothetical protein
MHLNRRLLVVSLGIVFALALLASGGLYSINGHHSRPILRRLLETLQEAPGTIPLTCPTPGWYS